MISDNKNDPANPHKIYQFPCDQHSAASGLEGSQETDCSSDLYLDDNQLYVVWDLENLYLGLDDHGPQPESRALPVSQVPQIIYHTEDQGAKISQTEPATVGSAASPEHQRWIVNGAEAGAVDGQQDSLCRQMSENGYVWDLENLYLGLDDHGPQPESRALPVSQVPQIIYHTEDQGAQISQTEPATVGSAASPEHQRWIVNGAEAGAVDGQQDSLCRQMSENGYETHFLVKAYYRGRMVLEQLVDSVDGFRVVYNTNADESGLRVVRLPPPEGISDQVQVQLTNNILDNLGGLEVRKVGMEIMAHRWGFSKFYWSLNKHERGTTPRELAKNTPQTVFHFKRFIEGLVKFLDKPGESPDYTLYFFLGEKWPDPRMKSWERKLIMIEVVLTSLEPLKMLAEAATGTSSLSVELQISLEQMMELC
ncbi:hypothetical protein DNTS_016432 [Danionella cerebrum]|uniref:Interferon regulatory factor-3 domain-containing protein n=1 Tax=Danionella cerebrum TaxID=2873325 RepID=A0A553PW39_9TELE|nr:hypothetical protein DNTS_016432 [Danionella translucida]